MEEKKLQKPGHLVVARWRRLDPNTRFREFIIPLCHKKKKESSKAAHRRSHVCASSAWQWVPACSYYNPRSCVSFDLSFRVGTLHTIQNIQHDVQCEL